LQRPNQVCLAGSAGLDFAYCVLLAELCAAALSILCPAGTQIFLTYRQVTTAVVVIVLDLSQPNSIIPTALQCLDLVQRKLAATYTLFERKGLQLPEQLRARQRAKLLSQHEDKDLITCSGISIVLAGTKWDVFRDSVEAEGQRVLGRCLRWIAHAHGAHLLYLGGMQAAGGPSTTGAAGAAAGQQAKQQQMQQQLQPQQLLDNFCRLLSHVTFVGMDRKMPLKLQPQFDHLGPLMVPAGE
jgi:dynein light intermediate chain 2